MTDEAQAAAAAAPIYPDAIDANAFTEAFGESLAQILNLDTWTPGGDLLQTYARLEQQIAEAIAQERRAQAQIRSFTFAKLREMPLPGLPDRGVIYQVKTNELAQVHRNLLFNGQVEACDGLSLPYDTLPLTIVQVGVCLVSYQGNQGSWAHRLYRRDLRLGSSDPTQEMLALLEARRRRGDLAADPRDQLSELARRGIATYAQRAILANLSQARWRLGQGNPAPYELLTGAGLVQAARDGQPSTYPLLRASLELLRHLLLEHQRFVFVPSAPSRLHQSLGYALRPLEFVFLDNQQMNLSRIMGAPPGHYPPSEARVLEDFINEAGPQIVLGVYRTSLIGPPQVFYAHRDHRHEAALVALADSMLQEHRGFPMLLTLADTVGRVIFGADTLLPAAQRAFALAGNPWRHPADRPIRR